MNRFSRTLAVPIFLIALFTSSMFGQTRRGMTPADTLRVAGVADAQISPDGEWVVYSVSAVDPQSNTTRTTLWLARTNGWSGAGPATRETSATQIERTRPAPVPLLPAGFYAGGARWSPDSRRLALMANKDGQSGIWIVSLTDRRPRFVAPVRETNFFITYAGESLAWSPDSRRLAFISASEDENAATAPTDRTEEANQRDDPRVIDRIQYKSRTSFADRARTHLWLVEVEAPDRESQPQQLTRGPFYDHAITWSPDGKELAFLSNREADPDANNNSDIFAVDMQGRERRITETKGCEYEPAWSPDGKLIAYTATKRELTTIDSVAEDAHLWVIDARGGAGRELNAKQDRRARSPRWYTDSRAIFYLANNQGRTTIYTYVLPTATILEFSLSLTPGGMRSSRLPIPGSFIDERFPAHADAPAYSFQIGSFSVSNSRLIPPTREFPHSSIVTQMAFTMSDATHPTEVWLESAATGIARQLSTHNEQVTRSNRFVAPEEIRFRSFDGTEIQGWLMRPLDFRETQRYPLILSVHGGPHGMSGSGFNPTFQAYAARGYAVLYLNPRGSSGYGQKFSDGTLREWGGGDYQDLMRGVDETLRRVSWIDPDRLGVTGGSYGGFMTNWIITQTNRFKAGVAAASVSNLISFYSTSLYQDLIHAEFGGFPWDDYDLLWRWSPMRYVRQAQTPLLLIHGEQDNDVHITQAEEMYMALKRRGVETVLVRYPREGHGLREPRHRQDALERTLDWFDRFLK
ncbi:MAG TPA: S9 family peptidase [Pyrinomonadaceae bacterium]|jgi:dipeptidyl aminopeptidase/acylaminoacyl peptidase